MTMKRTPRPRDPVQLGKLMVDIATGAVRDEVDDGKVRGVAGGVAGGQSRATKLTDEEKVRIAKLGSDARWKKS
jgi:hypothetical protein